MSETKPVDLQSLLDTSHDFDVGTMTIREFLLAILVNLWEQPESFTGKRVFGSSSWQYDIYKALVKAGAVAGKLDSDGFVDRIDDQHGADKLVLSMIAEMCKRPGG